MKRLIAISFCVCSLLLNTSCESGYYSNLETTTYSYSYNLNDYTLLEDSATINKTSCFLNINIKWTDEIKWGNILNKLKEFVGLSGSVSVKTTFVFNKTKDIIVQNLNENIIQTKDKENVARFETTILGEESLDVNFKFKLTFLNESTLDFYTHYRDGVRGNLPSTITGDCGSIVYKL